MCIITWVINIVQSILYNMYSDLNCIKIHILILPKDVLYHISNALLNFYGIKDSTGRKDTVYPVIFAMKKFSFFRDLFYIANN